LQVLALSPPAMAVVELGTGGGAHLARGITGFSLETFDMITNRSRKGNEEGTARR
jgi:hypothetical protein